MEIEVGNRKGLEIVRTCKGYFVVAGGESDLAILGTIHLLGVGRRHSRRPEYFQSDPRRSSKLFSLLSLRGGSCPDSRAEP